MQLLFYNNKFEDAIERYVLSAEQLQFTVTPKESIKLSNGDPSRYSILVVDGAQLVTFFSLHKNDGVKPYSNNEKAILLRSFSTDLHHQGKGYAKQALMLLPEFVKRNFAGINEIVLAVNLKNEVAQCLYKKCGYIDEGKRKMGEKGELIIMSHYLSL